MRKIGLVLVVMLVTGCDRATQACDDEIRSTLRAPSTYKRISADKTEVYGGSRVTIEYEAQNAMGVPLRQKHSCIISE